MKNYTQISSGYFGACEILTDTLDHFVNSSADDTLLDSFEFVTAGLDHAHDLAYDVASTILSLNDSPILLYSYLEDTRQPFTN